MNTRDLIAALQEVDPTGDTLVCVNNDDVYLVHRQPAYYDGALTQLVIDETKRGRAYSVAGVKIIRSGDKVTIQCLSVEDVLANDPEAPIEGGDPATIEQWRAEARKP